MHHLCTQRLRLTRIALPSIFSAALCAPGLSLAQASPFMTGATSLQTNARVAREYLVALPVELTPEQRLGLVRAFSQELSDRYRFAVDLSIHAPRDFPGSDLRNFHAHLLATTREVSTTGLAAKTTLEQSDSRRRELGLEPVIHELLYVRERWATVTNEALRNAHIAARVDHRTLDAQGIDREPRPWIPRVAYEMERHGYRSVLAERVRADYESRVQMRQERTAAQSVSDHADRRTGDSGARPATLEEIRRNARENWLRMRQESRDGPVPGGNDHAAHGADRALDDDLAR